MMRYIPFDKFDRVVRRLRKLIKADVGTSRRDALAMILGLHGLRVTEVVNLTIGDLDVIDELLLVKTLKRGKPRRLKLGPGVFKELRRLAHKRGADARLFVTGPGQPVRHEHWQSFARDVLTEVLGGQGLRFHALRHTFAMRLYVTSKDMQIVKARMGHRAIASTQVYIDAYTELDDDELRKWRRVEVLPALEGRVRGERPEKSVPKACPSKKTGKKPANQKELRVLQRTKTGSSAQRQKFPVSGPSATRFERGFISLVRTQLSEAAERVRQSG